MPGEIGVGPRIVRIQTNNTQAEVLAENFLQSTRQQGFAFFPSDIVALSYDDNTSQFFTVSINRANITLNLLMPNQSGIHETTWSGVWASPQEGDITWTKIGNLVMLSLPDVLAAGNSTQNNISMDTLFPSNLFPIADLQQPRIVETAGGGARAFGSIQITALGDINWGKDADFTAFDATTSFLGFISTTISYLTA